MKTRAEKRTRLVPHTVDGETEMVPDTYTVDTPVPPRDWDHIALTAVTAVAASMLLGSMIWTTTNVGSLLTAVAPAPIAYIGALSYDAPWICCLVLEWLARYDADKARAPRRAGHAFLVVAMASVVVHGYTSESLAVGIVAAVVSALAKTVWTLVMRHTSIQLEPRDRAWLKQRRARIGAQLAIAAEARQVARTQGQHAALLAATGAAPAETAACSQAEPHASSASFTASPTLHPASDPTPPPSPGVDRAPRATADTAQDVPADTRDAPQVTTIPRLSPQVTKTAAILAASSALQPDATPAGIAHLLAQQGLAVDTAYVRTVLAREAKKSDGIGQGGGGYA